MPFLGESYDYMRPAQRLSRPQFKAFRSKELGLRFGATSRSGERLDTSPAAHGDPIFT